MDYLEFMLGTGLLGAQLRNIQLPSRGWSSPFSPFLTLWLSCLLRAVTVWCARSTLFLYVRTGWVRGAREREKGGRWLHRRQKRGKKAFCSQNRVCLFELDKFRRTRPLLLQVLDTKFSFFFSSSSSRFMGMLYVTTSFCQTLNSCRILHYEHSWAPSQLQGEREKGRGLA